MKALVVLCGIALLLFVGWVVISSNREFREECERAGGKAVIGRYQNVCYEPGTVKFAR